MTDVFGQGLPVHPTTGLSALGWRKNGDPIWPIMGGDDTNNPPTPADGGIPLVEGGNPAWNDLLQAIPEEEWQKAVPILKQWDQGVQERFTQVHQEYEPWKDVMKSGLDPETVQFSTEVLAALQEDPRKIYDSLGEHFGWTQEEIEEAKENSGQGLETEDGQLPFDLEEHPAFQQLSQQNRVMADILLAQRNEQMTEREEAKLDEALSEAKKEHGEFDEDYVLMRMGQYDEPVDKAVEHYFKFTEKFGQKRPAPKLHSGSGGGAVPPPRLDPTKMSDRDVRNEVMKALMETNQEA